VDGAPFVIVGHGATHPGRVRPQNEDSMRVDRDLGLFAVADGMGGHNAGEVASSLALQTMQAFVVRSRADPDQTWPFGIDPSLDISANRLRTAVKLANRQVSVEAESRPEYNGMGTTISALLFGERSVALASIGDSRIYLVRSGTAQLLTQDHTWVQLLLAQNPGLDPQSIATHPMRHVLTCVIGAQEDLEVDVETRPIEPGDRFALTTDGVHGALSTEDIGGIVSAAGSVDAAAERLVASALERDGTDNLTAVVVQVSA
jgi:protein phosphatase